MSIVSQIEMWIHLPLWSNVCKSLVRKNCSGCDVCGNKWYVANRGRKSDLPNRVSFLRRRGEFHGRCDFPGKATSRKVWLPPGNVTSHSSLSLLTDSHSLSSHSFCRCLSSCQISWMRIETRFSLVSFKNQLPMALRFTEKPEFGQVQELSFQFASFSSFEILVLPPLSFSPPPLPRVNGSGLVKVFHFISHFQESLSSPVY